MPALALVHAAATPQSSPATAQVIVRALTAAGEPVADLKKEEITVRTDGKPREVKDLTIVRIATDTPAVAAPGAAAPAPPTLPPPFATNAAAPAAAAGPSDSRQFLILLDEEGLAPGREEPVRTALGDLISRLTPADRVGLLSLRIGGINLAPTANHASVKAALANIVGGGTSRETATDLACRTKRSLDTLVNAFRDAPAGRTILLVSSGFAPMTQQRMSTLQETNADVCMIRTTDLELLGNAAGASPANLYVLYYGDGLANVSLVSTAQQGLENVAGRTNGEYLRITGASDSAPARIPRETSVYYIATLDGAAGPIRRVDGRVAREGVRASIKPIGARSAGAPTAATSGKTPSIRDMFSTTASFTDVPLRAVGLVSRQGAADLKLVTIFEPADPSIKLTGASVGLVEEKGTTAKILWAAKPEELQRVPVMAAVAIAPGKYRVRVAATSAAGGGTVDYEIVAGLQEAAPLKLGGMMLGISSDKGFSPRMQFSGTDKMAVGVAEVYGVPKGANVTVQFEVAESERTPPIGSAPGNVQAGAGDDARVVFGGFGIETLQPGDYIMRAIVSLDGKPAGTITRTLRKVN